MVRKHRTRKLEIPGSHLRCAPEELGVPDRLGPMAPARYAARHAETLDMAGTDKKNSPPIPDEGKPKLPQPLPLPTDEDDYEDGDFATPKKDRYGTDDEPLE
jgi:hypothetical protein